MHLYHGTSASYIPSITSKGLGAPGDMRGYSSKDNGIFLTHDFDLAEDYAKNFQDPVVIKVRVNPRNLTVDWNSFDDPVDSYDDKGNKRSFDPSQLRDKKKDWKNSLKQTGAVFHTGIIPPENILGIE